MLYITYDSEACSDGVGSQIQRILTLYVLSKIFNIGYIHSNITLNKFVNVPSLKDIINENELSLFNNNLFNDLTLLHSNKDIIFSKIIHIEQFNIDVLNELQCKNTDNILVKLGYGHDCLDSHPELWDLIIPPNLNWINNKINSKLIIAIHIRRNDVSPHQNINRFVPVVFYIECINNLTNILSGYTFEYRIYSDTLDTKDVHQISSYCSTSNISFHINTCLTDTFKEFVNSDILIASKSSFSYSASFLRQKGIILYIPIRHVYSSKHVPVQSPDDIFRNKDKIIQSII